MIIIMEFLQYKNPRKQLYRPIINLAIYNLLTASNRQKTNNFPQTVKISKKVNLI